MLVLSRKTKQTIVIGSDVVVTVLSVKGNRVKIGIEAPNHVNVVRKELLPHESETWGGPGFDAGSIGHDLQAISDTALPARESENTQSALLRAAAVPNVSHSGIGRGQ